ncbi:DUF4124 domain-containing protein [Acidovorax sp. SUPP2522]|uniref:DUF4124 domain-containing protein n=1 Tax=unclassified Acidovorax TaxID=2684926 RepID=UPI002349D1DA|nr:MULTISPECIES: DUF4124 domain-containing protein [unclassified Acidovorax]WCM96548.1 DUF4124 domain-containing protein [Acidovorax sp. GBBC 1281]GKT20031.1 DUF4124 domain-containing protein [Acidovorax sp. SUPP2522]
MIKHAVLLIAAVAITPAWAINKCTSADGKTVFQDAPCAGKGEIIDVKPASGKAPLAPAQSQINALQKEGAFGETWRRKTDLEQHLIRNARADLQSHFTRCEQQQQALSQRKALANNNLAGATFEQSISAEMQAAATTCDTRARDLRASLESLEKELRELTASK